MKIVKNIDKFSDFIKKECSNSSDLVVRNITISNKKIAYYYFESVSSDDKISNFLMHSLSNIIIENDIFDDIFTCLNNNIFNSHIEVLDDSSDLMTYLASGFTILYVDNYAKCIVIETKGNLDRGVQAVSTEPIIRGPKDSFTENHSTNIGLIRKRIKDKNLVVEDVKVGRRTSTKVSTIYIKDVAKIDKVNIIINQLNSIDIDGIIDSGYIRELIEKNQNSSFPKVVSTERPDLVCSSLLNGKIVLLVENSPFALVYPAVLTDFIHSVEDEYQKHISASFSRILRIICFCVTISCPALYIALMTFNHEIIPDQLLISLASQREGVPVPTAVEVLIYVIAFEILREADIHSPNGTGSAMSIVGALILGDASVKAGIVSPIVIIVVAFTSISELVFYDIDMISAIREWRIVFIIPSLLVGLIGFVVASFIFIAKLSSLECLGTPYLAPISPFNFKDFMKTIFRGYRKTDRYRNRYLSNNLIKKGE